MSNFDLKSWLIGFALGLAGKPLPLVAGKEPSAYLYNGVQLPALPDELKVYRYLILFYLTSDGGTILAYGYDTEPTTELYENFLNSYERLKWDSGTYQAGNWYSSMPDEWFLTDVGNVSDASLGYHSTALSNIIWTNFNVYALDGTIYLAASEPVPVYGGDSDG